MILPGFTRFIARNQSTGSDKLIAARRLLANSQVAIALLRITDIGFLSSAAHA